MPGALLRTGTLKEFKSLGVDGQPVYSAALQLREAIRLRLGKAAADCLAIPQPNDAGDRIDWYAPEDGNVVPWSAAAPEERAAAYEQLESLLQQLKPLSSEMTASDQREHTVFGRLLSKAIHFPDEQHVYLVNGKPVITFWGFTGQASDLNDPLLCLRPVAPTPTSAPVAPAPVAPVVADRPGWLRWLWWLLPLLLLLLLLLFLLRACAPSVALPLGLDKIDLPGLPAAEVVPQDVVVDRVHDVHIGSDGVVGVPADGIADGSVAVPVTDEAVGDEAAAEGQEGTDAAGATDAGATTPETEQPEADTPAAGDEQAAQNPDQPGTNADNGSTDASANAPDMTIPPEALQSGSTHFLNGNWRAGSGIQDSRTGKPMRLAYDFKDGKGQVRIQRGDGVECRGDVSAAVQGGKLAINNQGQARCSDGSRYRMPEVTCAPNAKNVADCTGRYDDQQFPISMKQGGE